MFNPKTLMRKFQKLFRGRNTLSVYMTANGLERDNIQASSRSATLQSALVHVSANQAEKLEDIEISSPGSISLWDGPPTQATMTSLPMSSVDDLRSGSRVTLTSNKPTKSNYADEMATTSLDVANFLLQSRKITGDQDLVEFYDNPQLDLLTNGPVGVNVLTLETVPTVFEKHAFPRFMSTTCSFFPKIGQRLANESLPAWWKKLDAMETACGGYQEVKKTLAREVDQLVRVYAGCTFLKIDQFQDAAFLSPIYDPENDIKRFFEGFFAGVDHKIAKAQARRETLDHNKKIAKRSEWAASHQLQLNGTINNE